MAKKRISPELFRAGIVKTWPTNVKLMTYSLAIRQLAALQQQITSFWCNKNIRKLLTTKRQRRKVWFLRKKRYVNIISQTSQQRRRLWFTQLRFSNLHFYFRRRKWSRGVFSNHRYWYQKKQKKNSVRFKLLRSLKKTVNFQKRRLWFHNFFTANTLLLQRFTKNFLHIAWQDTKRSVGGSTALRRYQFNVLAIRPPRWTSYIHLKTASFKKMVGSILTRPKKYFYKYRYLLFLSQLNLALHWRSSYLFSLLLKALLEQRRRVQGTLRMVHEILMRLYLARYNVSCVKFMVTGSFGKLTRSKSMRLGRLAKETSHSLTMLTQSVSYSSTQIWTLRGVLGLRVWIFW